MDGYAHLFRSINHFLITRHILSDQSKTRKMNLYLLRSALLLTFAFLIPVNAFINPLRPLTFTRGNFKVNNLQMVQIDVTGKHMEVTPGKVLKTSYLESLYSCDFHLHNESALAHFHVTICLRMNTFLTLFLMLLHCFNCSNQKLLRRQIRSHIFQTWS